MKKLKSQSGRSMVEMLGVLAIIGVLSVGGIAGYSLAMRRHRANQVADIVSKYALILYNQCQQKISSGEITGHSSGDGRIRGCGDTELVEFNNADIGNIPPGTTSISNWGVENDEDTGVDFVRITVAFSDIKLCQAVGSISGTGCGTTTVDFKIKQN